MNVIEYFTGIFKGIVSLFKGMSVTGGYFFKPWKIVTQKYPENRKKLEMFERVKGEVILVHNENNQHKCNGCGICELNCPNGTIEIISKQIPTDNGKKQRIIDKHIYRMGMCTFCGLCVKSCPSKALAFTNTFEHAVFDRRKLTKILNKEGSSIMKGGVE